MSGIQYDTYGWLKEKRSDGKRLGDISQLSKITYQYNVHRQLLEEQRSEKQEEVTGHHYDAAGNRVRKKTQREPSIMDIMKRKLIIAFIMIAILLTACMAKQKYETKTIMNKFTISYPEDWKLSEDKDGNVTIYSGHLTTESIVFFRYSYGHEFEDLLEGWQSNDDDDTIANLKFEKKEVDSHDAFYVEYVLKKFPDTKSRKIFILLDSRVYSISENSTKDGVDEKELEKIVASISLKDSSVKIFEIAE